MCFVAMMDTNLEQKVRPKRGWIRFDAFMANLAAKGYVVSTAKNVSDKR